MGALRDELSIEDLASITKALRILKPKQPELICIGVEVPQPNDRSVVFHVMDKNDEGEHVSSVMIISAELILELFGGTGNAAERNA